MSSSPLESGETWIETLWFAGNIRPHLYSIRLFTPTAERSCPTRIACWQLSSFGGQWKGQLGVGSPHYRCQRNRRLLLPALDVVSVQASPLFVAAFAGYFSIVRYLLEKGAHVNVLTSNDPNQMLYGLTPLHGAASSGSREQVAIIRLLLQSGADPSVLSSNGSPIWTMMHCGSDAVTCLVEHGMSLTLRPKSENRTALHY